MAQHPYLVSRGKTGILWFRRAVPQELRPFVGCREVWRSLETRCPKEARRRLPQVEAHFDDKIEAARAALGLACGSRWIPDWDAVDARDVCPPGWTPLTLGVIPGLCARYRAHMLAHDDELRAGLGDAGFAAHGDTLAGTERQRRTAMARRDFAEIAETAAQILTAERFWVGDKATECALHEQLLAAELEVLVAQRARAEGQYLPTPLLPPPPQLTDTWEACLEGWRKAAAPADKTVDEVKLQISRFKSSVGDVPISGLTIEHVAQFKTACAERYRLSLSRTNTVISLLSPLVSHGIKNKLTPLTGNPFHGAKHSVKAVAKEGLPQRRAFEADELSVLFSSPVYTQGLRPAKGAGDAAFWIPLIATFTGARLEDIARLETGDILERGGEWCFRLHDSKRESADAGQCIRMVPIHAELRRIGLLEFVARRRAGVGMKTLFPRLPRDQYGTRSKTFSTWFGAYLDGLPGLDDPSVCFHSFRHTFQAFAEEAGIADRVIDEIVGHVSEPKAMRHEYGRKSEGRKVLPFSLLREGMDRFRIPGLCLAHLYNLYAPEGTRSAP